MVMCTGKGWEGDMAVERIGRIASECTAQMVRVAMVVIVIEWIYW